MLDQDTKHDTVQLSVSAAALRCDAIAEQLTRHIERAGGAPSQVRRSPARTKAPKTKPAPERRRTRTADWRAW